MIFHPGLWLGGGGAWGLTLKPLHFSKICRATRSQQFRKGHNPHHLEVNNCFDFESHIDHARPQGRQASPVLFS